MNEIILKIVLLEEAKGFIEGLPRVDSYKIFYNMKRIACGERNQELFKKLEGTNIWEFRTLVNKKTYRLFAFWDSWSETLVVVTHGILKKTQKTPLREIMKAEQIRKSYFNQKYK